MAVSPDPAAGPAPYASTVTIQVSEGKPQVEVPDVTGMNSAEARQVLEAAGLKVETSSWITGDRVVGQTPKAGETVEQGTTVKILLSFW
jgi:serine/threonine-protein kinase